MEKEYLVMVDMDGTLFDTSEVNFYAYQKALAEINVKLELDFYKKNCFGNHYKDFLGYILNEDFLLIEQVHERKKILYSDYLYMARQNTMLLMILKSIKSKSNIVLVTTASKKNVLQLLTSFDLEGFFDNIICQEDVKAVKPDPECYRKAIDLYNGVEPEKCIIFEDSEMGILAAKEACKTVIKIERF